MGQYKFHTQKAAYMWGVIATRCAKQPGISYFDKTNSYYPGRLKDLENTSNFFEEAIETACGECIEANAKDPAIQALGLKGIKALFEAQYNVLLAQGRAAVTGIDAYAKASSKGTIAFVSDGCIEGLAKLFLGLVDPVELQRSNSQPDAISDIARRLGAKILPRLESFVVKQEAIATGREVFTEALWALDRAWGISDPAPSPPSDDQTLIDVQTDLKSLKNLDSLLGSLSFKNADDLGKAKVGISSALADLSVAFEALNVDFTTSTKGFAPNAPESLDKFSIQMVSLSDALYGLRDKCNYDSAYIDFQDVVQREVRVKYEGVAQMTVARVQATVAKAEKSLAPKFWAVDVRPAGRSSSTSNFPWPDFSKVTETPENRPAEWFSESHTHSTGSGPDPHR